MASEKLSLAAKKWAQDVQGKGGAYIKGVQNPRRNPCDAFTAFVGQQSMATQKYCADYGIFQRNVNQYETIWNAGINRAIADNAYERGLTRGV